LPSDITPSITGCRDFIPSLLIKVQFKFPNLFLLSFVQAKLIKSSVHKHYKDSKYC